jgi:hypothetical protein
MTAHHTKNKGDLGVLCAQVDLCKQGYDVLVPLTEHAPFDLVAYKNGQFLRVQVKYRAASKGKITIPLETYWADKSGTHRRQYDTESIDLFCVYCPDTEECYYFSTDGINQSITLRIDPPKNNQVSGIKLAENYRTVPR